MRVRLLFAFVMCVMAALALHACGTAAPADPQGARIFRFAIDSAEVGRSEHVTVVVPRGARASARPLLLFLHGRGADDRSYLDTSMFRALRGLGRSAPILAFPDGGDHSYWHDRADGAWGRYVTDEVLPQVARRFHADRRRVAIGGISMGGFGALAIALRSPRRWCAIGAHSPALWRSAGETAPGAFDDAEDFTRHDVIAEAQARSTALGGRPLWIDAGDEDPFLEADHAFVAALREGGADVSLRTAPGGHDDDYWDGRWHDYLRFYATALEHCR